MKIVIPSNDKDEGSEIFSFFGMAQYFFIYEWENEESRLLEIRKNPESKPLRELRHSKKPPAVQEMIDKNLNDCHVFFAVGINEKIVENLTSRGKKVVFVDGGKIRELAERLSNDIDKLSIS